METTRLLQDLHHKKALIGRNKLIRISSHNSSHGRRNQPQNDLLAGDRDTPVPGSNYKRWPHKDPEICTSRNPIFAITIGLRLSPIRSIAHKKSFISTVLVPRILQSISIYGGGHKCRNEISFISRGLSSAVEARHRESTDATSITCQMWEAEARSHRQQGATYIFVICYREVRL
jgi:hypothetical protein